MNMIPFRNSLNYKDLRWDSSDQNYKSLGWIGDAKDVLYEIKYRETRAIKQDLLRRMAILFYERGVGYFTRPLLILKNIGGVILLFSIICK